MTNCYARRVDQLDAIFLDNELLSLLNSNFRRAFSYFPQTVLSRFGPELDTLFKFCYKYLPYHVLGGSFGQNVFQLCYKDSSTLNSPSLKKLQTLAFITIALPWFWDRIIRKLILSLNNECSRKASDVSYMTESKLRFLYKMMSCVNFCIFLQKGQFSSVEERILNVRPLYMTKQDIRPTQYEGISRELLWHGLCEFLGFILPLINIYRLKGYLRRKCLPWAKSYRSKYFFNTQTCGICGNVPTFPHTIGCLHVFCYYCISSSILADPVYFCFDCDTTVNGVNCIKPLAINAPSISVKT
ncbi:peroxisome biogenesis factor 2-like [Uloborus diversus]|uniref:peroxisome biogenesis factor 2-like n=1 Tax=Uloborus diversus TaxID=327109 RepID=UPI00240A4DB2|nr:peroxisome biogenesis factor 2-like [Uloborus diversus]